MNYKKLLNKYGFTLVELVIILAILTIIFAIVIPKFSDISVKAKINGDNTTAIELGHAAEAYLDITENYNLPNEDDPDKVISLDEIEAQGIVYDFDPVLQYYKGPYIIYVNHLGRVKVTAKKPEDDSVVQLYP